MDSNDKQVDQNDKKAEQYDQPADQTDNAEGVQAVIVCFMGAVILGLAYIFFL